MTEQPLKKLCATTSCSFCCCYATNMYIAELIQKNIISLLLVSNCMYLYLKWPLDVVNFSDFFYLLLTIKVMSSHDFSLDDVLWIYFSVAILNEAFRSPDHKTFFSLILGCPQDLNFARPFWYGWVETGLNGRNGRAKCKSCGRPRIKLKKCLVVGRPKSFIENCRKKIAS